jgi:outer membrane protease
MAVDFQVLTINVEDPVSRDPVTGRQEFEGLAIFPSNVNRAVVALNGFKMDYAGNGVDHQINVVEIDTDLRRKGSNAPPVHDNHVHFVVECQYADKNFDDPYFGYVSVTVIADRV